MQTPNTNLNSLRNNANLQLSKIASTVDCRRIYLLSIPAYLAFCYFAQSPSQLGRIGVSLLELLSFKCKHNVIFINNENIYRLWISLISTFFSCWVLFFRSTAAVLKNITNWVFYVLDLWNQIFINYAEDWAR